MNWGERFRFSGSVLIALGLFVGACTSLPARSSPSSQAVAAAQPQSQTTSAAAVPASTPTPDQGARWDQIVAAAKREGTVAVYGPEGTDSRDALTQGFEAKYPGVSVDYTGLSGAEAGPKVLLENSSGLHSTDLIITGTNPAIPDLLDAGALTPIQPYLTGPATEDPSKWLGGKLLFADNTGEYSLIFSEYVKPPIIYNPDLVDPSQFSTWRDLLDPKWRGKMAIRDGLVAGAGQGLFLFWYSTDSLGKDFIQELYDRDPTISSDDAQLMDWVARGEYPIAMGVSDTLTNEDIDRGLPIARLPSEAFKEGSYLVAGNGGLSVLAGAPHPNALAVYLDWFLSVDGQLAYSKVVGVASLRQDVPHDFVVDALVPKPGEQYQEQSNERYIRMRSEMTDWLKSIGPPQ